MKREEKRREEKREKTKEKRKEKKRKEKRRLQKRREKKRREEKRREEKRREEKRREENKIHQLYEISVHVSQCGKESRSCASPSTLEEDFSHMRAVSGHVWHFCSALGTHAVQDAVDFVACKLEENTSRS
ncbi:hypothetical protein Baya_12519 [Bagarius yarrelli]|uniref:Uncharacterized protein n=1 Tax=Bagarius yarrelli TaxID=175774 RepID=A0A556V3G6_BAGYA|nr:hypothetical protein Baya_12519 [Bagarius yarrelli]